MPFRHDYCSTNMTLSLRPYTIKRACFQQSYLLFVALNEIVI